MECPSNIFNKQNIISLKLGKLPNFNNNNKKNNYNLFYFIILTQDCQFIISHPDQLSKISLLKINYKINDCASNRIKLIWQFISSKPSLLLIQKRSKNKICILPIETPNFNNIQKNELFSYSLYSSLLRFSKCSYLNKINIEIEYIIQDLLYSDLFYIYYSSIFYQLRLSLNGQIRFTGEQFSFNLIKELNLNFSDLILSNDPQTNRLFIIPKIPKINSLILKYTSPFDILYRKDQAKFINLQLIKSFSSLKKQWKISSFSVDRNLIIFTVSNYSNNNYNYSNKIITELFISKIPLNNNSNKLILTNAETHCVLNLIPFDVNLKTYEELTKRGALPQMDDTIIEKENKINKNKIGLKQIKNEFKTITTMKVPTKQTTISTLKTKSFNFFKTNEQQIKTTKQTLKTTPETTKLLRTTTTTELHSTKQTTLNLNSEKSEEKINLIPIIEKEREQIEEEKETLNIADDNYFEQQPLTLEEELEENEEYNNNF
ncbi:hypothetical protein Mgra_00002408 [Meloidogyne graminicola]|uniref:Uncharacterized protein n=1 Tax=Meloidogyne graminicola TaxID=189291 RepID=A0A8S9ZWZ6_9BILA|nr:hypothetical protein Mgra_00002408 [Meloidogyne graminicola]